MTAQGENADKAQIAGAHECTAQLSKIIAKIPKKVQSSWLRRISTVTCLTRAKACNVKGKLRQQ